MWLVGDCSPLVGVLRGRDVSDVSDAVLLLPLRDVCGERLRAAVNQASVESCLCSPGRPAEWVPQTSWLPVECIEIKDWLVSTAMSGTDRFP